MSNRGLSVADETMPDPRGQSLVTSGLRKICRQGARERADLGHDRPFGVVADARDITHVQHGGGALAESKTGGGLNELVRGGASQHFRKSSLFELGQQVCRVIDGQDGLAESLTGGGGGERRRGGQLLFGVGFVGSFRIRVD